jgi:hypothetical protein
MVATGAVGSIGTVAATLVCCRRCLALGSSPLCVRLLVLLCRRTLAGSRRAHRVKINAARPMTPASVRPCSMNAINKHMPPTSGKGGGTSNGNQQHDQPNICYVEYATLAPQKTALVAAEAVS